MSSVLSRGLAAVLHRSGAGPAREIVVAGAPVCRRCAALSAGAVVAFLLALLASPPAALLAALVAPAVADAYLEKGLGRPHRPRRLLAANVAAGLALGVLLAQALRGFGAFAVMGGLAVARLVARGAGPRRHRATLGASS